MFLKERPVPERPKLRTYLRIQRISEDRMVFEAGGDTVTLNGTSVSDLVPLLLQRLDGTNTLSSIKQELTQVEPEVIDQALLVFAQHHLLEDASCSPPSTIPESLLQNVQHQLNFWLSVRSDRYESQELLWNANVCILGLGEVGAMVADLLVSAGVGSLLLVDAKTPSKSGRMPWDNHPIQARRWFSGLQPTGARIELAEAVIDDQLRLQSLIAGSHLAILCQDFRNALACRSVNEACLNLDVPWLSAHVDHNRAVIGPFVVPRQTACFRCYEYRCQGNSVYGNPGGNPEAIAETEPSAYGALTPFAGFVANYLSLEAIKSITRFAYPSTASRVHTFDFFTMESEFHEVLKLPRCPSCGPARSTPLMKIWDLEAPRNIRKRS